MGRVRKKAAAHFQHDGVGLPRVALIEIEVDRNLPSSDDVREVVEVASADHRGEVVHRDRSVRLVVDGRANVCYEHVAQIGMRCRAGRVGERGRLNEKLAAHIHW